MSSPSSPFPRAAAALVPVLAVAVGCGPPDEGPTAPYDHPPMSESSVASAVVVGGEVGALADGLADAGFFCAQARANAVAVQVRCRRAPGPEGFDLVATPSGQLTYGRLDLVLADTPSRDLQDVLDAAVLRVWPEHREDLADLVADAQPPEPFLGDDDGPQSYEERFYDERTTAGPLHYTLSVSWGEPMLLEMRGTGLRDHSWPFGADHYARTLTDAVGPLTAEGFQCSETACWRPADDQTLLFRTSGDQITEISFDLPDRPGAGAWMADGLPFLTPAVEPAVREQIVRSVAAGRSFAGVVAGTVLIVDTPQPYWQSGSRVPGSTVTIGVPLIFLE